MKLTELKIAPGVDPVDAFELYEQGKFDEIGEFAPLSAGCVPADDAKENLLFIPPLCGDCRVYLALCSHLIKELANRDIPASRVRLVCAELTGHGTQAEELFEGIPQECAALEADLAACGITTLKLVAGFSVGGVFALQLYARQTLPIENCFLDSAPLFDRAPVLERGMIIGTLEQRKVAHKNPEKFLAAFEGPFASTGPIMLSQMRVAREENIKSYIHECANAGYPALSDGLQERLFIRYGGKDMVKKGLKKAEKVYPQAHVQILQGLTHVEGIAIAPGNFAQWIVSNAWDAQ